MRNLTLWEPFRDLMNLQARLDRAFKESGKSITGDAGEGFDSATWTPVVDISENSENFVIKADIPGVKKEDINIDINDKTLSIKGVRKLEKEESKDDYIRIERSYGEFSRSFSLPQNIDTKNIKASYKDGILELTLPKKEEAKPKKINIDVS